MTIEVTSLAKMIVIMISISLMLSNWQPPIPRGQQSLICMTIGAGLGYVFGGFAIDGIMLGLISSAVAYWRKELFDIFSEVKDETSELLGGEKHGKV